MKKMMIGMLAMMALAACNTHKEQETKDVATVKVAEVEPAGDTGVWQFPGRVKAGSEVNVAFKVAGTLKRVAVSEGQRVAAGTLLAEMDDTDYRVQLAATEAEYAQVKAEAERVIKLYEQGGTTASNYDKARYGLEQITAKLSHHRNQLAYCRIYAPQAGTVQSTLFEGGETVAAGMPIVRLVGSGRSEVEMTVPAAVRSRLVEMESGHTGRTGDGVAGNGGMSATAVFTSMPERTFTLRLLHVLPKANATGMYPVRLAIEGSTQPTPGMAGWVTISCNGSDENAEVMLPSTAIVHSAEGDYIYKVSDGKAVKTAVEVHALTGDGKARVSGNIAVGETVVASGAHHVMDGQQVEPLAPTSPTNIGGLL